MSPLWAW